MRTTGNCFFSCVLNIEGEHSVYTSKFQIRNYGLRSEEPRLLDMSPLTNATLRKRSTQPKKITPLPSNSGNDEITWTRQLDSLLKKFPNRSGFVEEEKSRPSLRLTSLLQIRYLLCSV